VGLEEQKNVDPDDGLANQDLANNDLANSDLAKKALAVPFRSTEVSSRLLGVPFPIPLPQSINMNTATHFPGQDNRLRKRPNGLPSIFEQAPLLPPLQPAGLIVEINPPSAGSGTRPRGPSFFAPPDLIPSEARKPQNCFSTISSIANVTISASSGQIQGHQLEPAGKDELYVWRLPQSGQIHPTPCLSPNPTAIASRREGCSRLNDGSCRRLAEA